MATKLNVIYVPGLGDVKSQGQSAIVKLWSIYGVRGHYFPLIWSDGEDFKPKLDRLVSFIDSVSDGKGVALIGTSAGASAVINAFALRKHDIKGLVLICGKINNAQTIDKKTYLENPAFKGSMEILPSSLNNLDEADRNKIMSIHPLKDGRVPVGDTYIPGAKMKTIISVGHPFSIAVAMILGSYTMIKYLKRLSASN